MEEEEEEEGEEKKKSRLNATFYYDFPSFSKQIVSPFYYHNTFGGQWDRAHESGQEKKEKKKKKKNKTNFLSRFPHKVFLIPDLSGAGRCFSPCLSVSVGT